MGFPSGISLTYSAQAPALRRKKCSSWKVICSRYQRSSADSRSPKVVQLYTECTRFRLALKIYSSKHTHSQHLYCLSQTVFFCFIIHPRSWHLIGEAVFITVSGSLLSFSLPRHVHRPGRPAIVIFPRLSHAVYSGVSYLDSPGGGGALSGLNIRAKWHAILDWITNWRRKSARHATKRLEQHGQKQWSSLLCYICFHVSYHMCRDKERILRLRFKAEFLQSASGSCLWAFYFGLYICREKSSYFKYFLRTPRISVIVTTVWGCRA